MELLGGLPLGAYFMFPDKRSIVYKVQCKLDNFTQIVYTQVMAHDEDWRVVIDPEPKQSVCSTEVIRISLQVQYF